MKYDQSSIYFARFADGLISDDQLNALLGARQPVDREGWCAYLASVPRPITLDDVDDAIESWYDFEGNAVGGALHIVLDDGNWKREHLAWSRQHAYEEGDFAAVAFADFLLELSDGQLETLQGPEDE